MTPAMIQRARALAASGRSVSYIGAAIGRSESAVRRHAGDVLRRVRLARRARMFAAVAALVPQAELAERFGYANANSFKVALCIMRRRAARRVPQAAARGCAGDGEAPASPDLRPRKISEK